MLPEGVILHVQVGESEVRRTFCETEFELGTLKTSTGFSTDHARVNNRL